MAKYETGNYYLMGFDDYGAKIFSKPSLDQNLGGSIAEGDTMVTDGECASYVVYRVLVNSKDRSDSWLPK